MLHVPVPLFLDLSHSDVSYLTFSHDNLPYYPDEASAKPHDVFEESARRMDITFHIINEYFYGYFIDHSLFSLDYARHLVNIVCIIFVNSVSPDSISFNRIFVEYTGKTSGEALMARRSIKFKQFPNKAYLLIGIV